VSIEAMKQALERVDRAIEEPNITMSDGKALKEILRQLHLIKDALCAAIVEAEKHSEDALEMVEPVAWRFHDGDIKRDCYGRINWQCRDCGRWGEPVDAQTERLMIERDVAAKLKEKNL